MPKKPPKNAFYYFMQDFKEQQQKKGITYTNLAEVAKAADPEWRNAHTSVRVKFEQIAKQVRQKNNIPNVKYTSTGIPLSQVERQQREMQEAADFEKQDIKNMIKLKAFNIDNILEEDFFVMDVNYYCKTDTEYVIAESTVLRFNLKQGFLDFYHEAVNPGRIPVGYASDVMHSCQEFGLEMPDETKTRSNYMHILANIIDYLKQSGQNVNTLPPLYTMPEKVNAVQDFILQMCNKAGEDEFLFRIYRLDTLFFTLINAIKTGRSEGFPKESLALMQLRKDVFKYTPKLACEHHEASDRAVECTTSRSKRWAYTILDSCCPIVGIDVKAGMHLPQDYDLDRIMLYKDQKKERAAPTIAGFGDASSSCNTTVESVRDYANTSVASDPPRKEKRTYAPMRMPQADYSKDIRPAPELTEDNFPTLSIGAGRGRGLGNSFSRLNIKK